MKNAIRYLLLSSLGLVLFLQMNATSSFSQTRGSDYICTGDSLPQGFVITKVTGENAPENLCGPFTGKAMMSITRPVGKSFEICGSSSYPFFSPLHPDDYIVRKRINRPQCSNSQGLVIEKLVGNNKVCNLELIGFWQRVVPDGYTIVGIDTTQNECPHQVFDIKIPAKRELICSDLELLFPAPIAIPWGYKVTSNNAFSVPCQGRAWEIKRDPSIGVPPVPPKPEDLVALSCGAEGTLKSLESTTPTIVEFANATNQTIQIYWLNFDGQRVFYNTLSAGQSYLQSTYLTHPWIIIDQDNVCRGIFMPRPITGRAVIR